MDVAFQMADRVTVLHYGSVLAEGNEARIRSIPKWQRYISEPRRLILEVADLHTDYGYSHILQGVSLKVERGQIMVFLGRNGVRNTTLVHSIIPFVSGKTRFAP